MPDGDPETPPMGGGQDSGPSGGTQPPAGPSGDSVGITPPSGSPSTPESLPAIGQTNLGHYYMGVGLLHILQAIKSFPPGEDHQIAMEVYLKAAKHFKKQEPLTPSPQSMARPSVPSMPQPPGGGGGALPGMGGAMSAPQGQPMGQPQIPRGPIPVPQGAGI